RNRVEGVLDFSSGLLSFQVNPSCSEASEPRLWPPGWNTVKECHRPQDEGSGNNVDVSRQSDGSIKIVTNFQQSDAFSPAGICSIHNDLIVRAAADNLSLSVSGARFPSLAIIHNGRVVGAFDGGTGPWNLLSSLCQPSGFNPRTVTYTTPIPE